jgi:hypothetical protein
VTNRADIDISNLNSGVFVYQIVSGQDRKSGKIFVF